MCQTTFSSTALFSCSWTKPVTFGVGPTNHGGLHAYFESNETADRERILTASSNFFARNNYEHLDLPAVNGSLNALSAIFLTAGYVFIKRRTSPRIATAMIAGFRYFDVISRVLSDLPLLFGVRLASRTTVFKDPPWFRPIYLAILGRIPCSR